MPTRTAAVFDLDGTLIDSLDDIAVALAAALADHGVAAPERAQVQAWIGDGARALVARAVATLAPHLDVDTTLATFRSRYRDAPVVHTRVYDGIAEVLDGLAARGVALAVLTNKPHALAVPIVERLLPGRFAAIAGGDHGVPLKPDRRAGEAIAAALGVPPGACTLIGDSPVDVGCARAAGMGAIAVTWGLVPRAALVDAAPDHLVDTPADLLRVLR